MFRSAKAALAIILVSAILGINILSQASAQDGSNNTTNLISLASNMTTIQAEDDSPSLTTLFRNTQQSVVQISSTMGTTLDFTRASLGSGFVFDEEGHIITNYHVIAGAANMSSVDVTFYDGTIYRAQVIGTDPYSDLAVLAIQEDLPEEKLVPLTLGNSSNLQVGQQAVAIGNPFGLSGSMTSGIISGLNRLLPAQTGAIAINAPSFSIPNIIQTDAAVNPGNSGGPLLNMQGEVIGINTAIYSTTGQFAGVGFAVPADAIAKIVPVLIEQGSFQHSWLGISGTDMTSQIAQELNLAEPRGFLVIDVASGGPADRAGVQGGDNLTQINGREIPLGGDVILAIDDNPVRKIDDLLGYLEQGTEVGEQVSLTIWRDGETMELTARLAARPSITSSP